MWDLCAMGFKPLSLISLKNTLLQDGSGMEITSLQPKVSKGTARNARSAWT